MRTANLAGRLVLLVDGGAIDVERASGGRFGADPQAVYARWGEFGDWAAGADLPAAASYDPQQLGSPAPRPSQVLAIGLNYRAHAEESGFALPAEPVVVTKDGSSLTGPSGDIVLSRRPENWDDFFKVVKTLDLPADFMCERGDSPPQVRELF